MKIDEKGIVLSTLNDILDAYELQLQSKYGADFYIKPEGVIDNIAQSSGFMEMSLQEQIAFLGKQFDPETAEGVWQDKLYERINLYRLEAQSTVFTKGIIGTPGFSAEAGSVTIRLEATGDEFVNSEAFTIEDSGAANIRFECVITGVIPVNAADTFQIVEAPNEITAISQEDATDIATGRERESDDEFRIRYRTAKAINAKATRNANIANLSKYVDNIAFLKIFDKKTDYTMEAGTLLVIAKHNTTDAAFANAVFESVTDGIDLLGDDTQVVKDRAGQDVTINWKNADEIQIDITGIIKVRDGYYPNTVIANAKQSILAYIEKRVFGLESIIYATEFIIPVLQTDGVEAVIGIQIKKHDDEEFTDSVSLSREEVPEFALERISLTENN